MIVGVKNAVNPGSFTRGYFRLKDETAIKIEDKLDILKKEHAINEYYVNSTNVVDMQVSPYKEEVEGTEVHIEFKRVSISFVDGGKRNIFFICGVDLIAFIQSLQRVGGLSR